MKMVKRKFNIDKILKLAAKGPSEWELDNIIWGDRLSNPKTLLLFLERIKTLESLAKSASADEQKELQKLRELADDLNEEEVVEMLSDDEETVKHNFIESLARQNALEVLCKDRMSIESMTVMCKLSPNDFILVSKRTQDLINSIHELVIQGETLSSDVAGA